MSADQSLAWVIILSEPVRELFHVRSALELQETIRASAENACDMIRRSKRSPDAAALYGLPMHPNDLAAFQRVFDRLDDERPTAGPGASHG